MSKIAIIGAGPVGSYLAYLLARKGQDVSVFEEHPVVGLPVHCTGITTFYLDELVKLNDEFIVNRVSRARIFAPSGNYLDLNLRENIILDRAKFDQYLMNLAKEAGAKFFLSHKFVNFDCNTVIVKNLKTKKTLEYNTDYLVGADGSKSPVAHACGLWKNHNCIFGMQVRVELNNENIIEFYPYIGQYAWVVPESNKIVRIGIAQKKPNLAEFNDFLKSRLGGYKVIDRQAGLIPIYNPGIITKKNNIFLVGDAATQVKATTGGGIIPGLMGAKALAESIIYHKNYPHEWKRLLGKDLWLHLKIYKMISKFSDGDWNRLIHLLNKDSIKQTISEYDREFPSKFILKLMVKEPHLLSFAKFLL